MSEEKTIHDIDFNMICTYFGNLNRQSPGSIEATKEALSFIPELSDDAQIADIGCGTGTQTLTLAQNTKGNITGIDLFPHFTEKLNNRAKEQNLSNRVKAVTCDMTELSIAENSLDLLWSEGAIYNIGFEKGITEWKRFIKKDGYIAITDATWFTKDRPVEIEKFWADAYNGVTTPEIKIAQLLNAGYKFIASFALPTECWTKNYYEPQKIVQKKMLDERKGDKSFAEFISMQKNEAQMYEKYGNYYGYVFYIAKKI